MIVRPRPGMFTLFFVMRGSIVPRIAPHIIGFSVYAAAVMVLMQTLQHDYGPYALAPFALLGVTLSIYLAFRNNAAYERWWEARGLWGELVYGIRNLARAALALIPAESGHARPLLMDAVAFCHLLRGQLRGVDAGPEARAFIGDGIDSALATRNPADELLRRMGRRLGEMRSAGDIDTIGFRILDERLAALAALQAGCERIAGTPLPFAYTLLLHRSAYLFCLLLPFALAAPAGWSTPVFTALLAYSFFGLDALSEELEDPFGTEENDLALDALCRVCETSVLEALGDPAPEALPPKGFCYS